MLIFLDFSDLWLRAGEIGDVGGGGEFPLLCESGGVIASAAGHPGKKDGWCAIPWASWALNCIPIKAAAAAVGFAKSWGANREKADGLKPP